MTIKQKYLQLAIPVKATIWFTTCNFILKGISFLTGPIFTRLLPTDEYGKLSIFMSYEQLILILSTWEMQLGAYQKGIFKYENDLEGFTRSSQAITNIFTVIFFVILFIFHDYVTRITGMTIEILVILFMYMIVMPSYTSWIVLKRKNYEYKSAVAVTLVYSTINVIIPAFSIVFFERTADIKFASSLISSSLIAIFFYKQHMNYSMLATNREKTKEYWKFCIKFEGPAVLHSLSYLVLGQADRIMINEMLGASDAALYSVAYAVASVVSILQISINASLVPWRFRKLSKKEYIAIRASTSRLLLGMGFFTFIFILLIPEIFTFIFPESYKDAVRCIPPISMGVYFMFLYTVFVNIEEYYEKTQYVAIVSITCGLINVLLNYCAIPMYGYVACAYTTLISYVLFAVGHYTFMKKVLKQNYVRENLVDVKDIVSISLAFFILSVLITVFYEDLILRYSICIGILVIAFIFRKKIYDFITDF